MSKLVKTPNTVTDNTTTTTTPGIQGLDNGQGKKLGIIRRLNNGSGTTTTILPPEEKDQFFYHGDHLGSSNMITDSKGSVYQHLEYFPYGETWIEEGGSYGGNTPGYKFTGKELDPETGLYYFGARYYEPVISRWISADPILGKYLPTGNKEKGKILAGIGGVFNPINLNMYCYAGSNPLKFIDMDGNDITVSIITTKINEIALPQSVPLVAKEFARDYVNPVISDINKASQHIIGSDLTGTVKVTPTFDNNNVGVNINASLKLDNGTISTSSELNVAGNFKVSAGYTTKLTNELSLTVGAGYKHDELLAGSPGENVGTINISVSSGGGGIGLPLPSFITNKLPKPTPIDQ